MPTKVVGIKLKEVSFVDRPANQGAKVSFFKFLEGDQKIMDELKEMLKNFQESLQKLLNPKINKGDNPNMDKEELQKQLDALKAKTEELEKQNKELDAMSKMSDAEKAYAQNLSDKKRQEFMAMSADERKACMTKRETESPELKKALEEKTALEKRLVALEEQTQVAEFTKRAEKEYPHVPGKPEDKGILLKAIDSMPEAQKTAMQEILKSAEAALAKQMSELGNNNQDNVNGEDPDAKLKELANKRMEGKDITFQKAYADVLLTSEGIALYNKSEKARIDKIKKG